MRAVLFILVCFTPGIFSAPSEGPTTQAPVVAAATNQPTAPPADSTAPPAPAHDSVAGFVVVVPHDGNQKQNLTQEELAQINGTQPLAGLQGDRFMNFFSNLPFVGKKDGKKTDGPQIPFFGAIFSGGPNPGGPNPTKTSICKGPVSECPLPNDKPDVGVQVFGDKYKVAEKGNPWSTGSGFFTSSKDREGQTSGQSFATGLRDGAKAILGASEGGGDLITEVAGKGKNRVSQDKTFLDPFIDGAIHGLGTIGGTGVDIFADTTGMQGQLKDIAYIGGFAAGASSGGKAAEVILPAKAAYDGIKTAAVLLGQEKLIGMRGKAGSKVVRVAQGGDGRLKRRKPNVKAPAGARLGPEDYYYYAYDDGSDLNIEGLPLPRVKG